MHDNFSTFFILFYYVIHLRCCFCVCAVTPGSAYQGATSPTGSQSPHSPSSPLMTNSTKSADTTLTITETQPIKTTELVCIVPKATTTASVPPAVHVSFVSSHPVAGPAAATNNVVNASAITNTNAAHQVADSPSNIIPSKTTGPSSASSASPTAQMSTPRPVLITGAASVSAPNSEHKCEQH